VSANVSTQWRSVWHCARREHRMLFMSRTVLFDKPACESSWLLCGVFCTCLDHNYVDITVSYKRWCTGSFLTLITTVIVTYIAYTRNTRVVCASMHVLFPVRKFLLCAIAFVPGKLRVILKIADQSRAGSHFNSPNTHSQFRNSHFTRALPGAKVPRNFRSRERMFYFARHTTSRTSNGREYPYVILLSFGL